MNIFNPKFKEARANCADPGVCRHPDDIASEESETDMIVFFPEVPEGVDFVLEWKEDLE